jgi:septum formation protein
MDEHDHPRAIRAGELAEYLARRKAEVVALRFPGDVVLAADTVVAFAEAVLSKPADASDARRMLRLLSGTTHSVITGVAVIHATARLSRHTRVLSAVQMRALSDEEIDRYITSGEWQGKAGGYGIQDPDPFVTRTSGCLTNIVGLPMTTTADLLRDAGVEPQGS